MTGLRCGILAPCCVLAACASPREPVVQTVEVRVPIAVACDPKVGAPPAYPDGDQALRDAPGAVRAHEAATGRARAAPGARGRAGGGYPRLLGVLAGFLTGAATGATLVILAACGLYRALVRGWVG